MAEGSDSKDTSSPNEVVETFLEPNNDQVVPPSLPSPEYVPLSHTGSKVRVKPYSVPSSEQLALMRRVPEQIVIARQPASTNIDESERHSLDNTGSNNNSPDNSGNLVGRNSCCYNNVMMFYRRKFIEILQRLFYLTLVVVYQQILLMVIAN